MHTRFIATQNIYTVDLRGDGGTNVAQVCDMKICDGKRAHGKAAYNA